MYPVKLKPIYYPQINIQICLTNELYLKLYLLSYIYIYICVCVCVKAFIKQSQSKIKPPLIVRDYGGLGHGFKTHYVHE